MKCLWPQFKFCQQVSCFIIKSFL